MKLNIKVIFTQLAQVKYSILKVNFVSKPLLLLLVFILLCSHDLYVKMETYFLQPNQEATLSLYNGTFEKSENIIARNRMLDASIVAQGKRVAIDTAQWKDQDSTITQLTFNTGPAGTYVAGVSTKARNIELTAEKFNSYLEHDGVLDMLDQRTIDDLLDQDATERYEKHVKAIYQVGDIKTNDWNVVLGYPIEFVPKANPYETYSGEKLEVQLLSNGKPLPKQLVYANYVKSDEGHAHDEHSHDHAEHDKEHSHDHAEHEKEHSHDDAQSNDAHSHDHAEEEKEHSHDHAHTDDAHSHSHKSQNTETHTHTSGQQLRTNNEGIVTVDFPEDGIYYLRTIYMTRVDGDDELTHRSKRATLTFEISHKHNAADTHTHHHEDEGGIPIWVFALSSLLIIGLLFFIFRKKD